MICFIFKADIFKLRCTVGVMEIKTAFTLAPVMPARVEEHEPQEKEA
jgi:hypothetical protein